MVFVGCVEKIFGTEIFYIKRTFYLLALRG